MSALTPTARPASSRSELGATLRRAARRNTWTLGLWGLLIALLLYTRFIQATYGAREIESLAISALPVALAAVAQAIAVISGGIDLSIGSTMALTSVTAASLMAGGSEESAIAVVLGVLVLGIVIGVVNGTLIVVTKVPDIVVTLAMSFVWAGAALLVLNTPGGGSARWLRDLIDGTVLIEWVPRALIVLVVVVGVVWIPLRRSNAGLSLYAVGSDRLAAFRSGVAVGRTKVMAYGLTGLFAAAGGLAVTASTGIGSPIPGPYTLESVAAVVLGGVSLAGGRGGLVGPIVAVFVLALVRADLTFLHIDPNITTVIRGVILVGVVMFGGLVAIRGKRA
jgi:ribose transport system permease protein